MIVNTFFTNFYKNVKLPESLNKKNKIKIFKNNEKIDMIRLEDQAKKSSENTLDENETETDSSEKTNNSF